MRFHVAIIQGVICAVLLATVWVAPTIDGSLSILPIKGPLSLSLAPCSGCVCVCVGRRSDGVSELGSLCGTCVGLYLMIGSGGNPSLTPPPPPPPPQPAPGPTRESPSKGRTMVPPTSWNATRASFDADCEAATFFGSKFSTVQPPWGPETVYSPNRSLRGLEDFECF